MHPATPYEILLFYKYVRVADPEALCSWLRNAATAHALTGRILVAQEGLNGTVEGTPENTAAFADALHRDVRFSDMRIKRSRGTGSAFPKLTVKVRAEIVGTRFPDSIDPQKQTATHLPPETLRAWLREEKDFVIVDMRNDYEYRSGHFKGSVNPGLRNARDLPDALAKLAHLKNRPVLTVCTGGVRCEKMSALLLEEGFSEVYQLEDGIHGYMEKYPGEDFIGTLYTFDDRTVMDFGGTREIIGRCQLCDRPTERYANCANGFCRLHFLACEACTDARTVFCTRACGAQVL